MVVGLYGESMFGFIRSCKAIFHRGCQTALWIIYCQAALLALFSHIVEVDPPFDQQFKLQSLLHLFPYSLW